MKAKTSFVILLLLILSGSCFADAWTQRQGRILLAPRLYIYSVPEQWDASGNPVQLPSIYSKEQFNIYYEYGMLKDTTLILNTNFDRINYNGVYNAGMSDIDLGLMTTLINTNTYSLVLKSLIIIPSYNTGTVPLLGYGKFGYEIGVVQGVASPRWRIETGLSFRSYGGYPNDQIRGNILGGLFLGEKVTLTVNLNAAASLPANQTLLNHDPVFAENYSLLNADICLETKINRNLSYKTGVTSDISGKSIAKGSSWYFGMSIHNDAPNISADIKPLPNNQQ